MTLFILVYHWVVVSHTCKCLGFWSVRRLSCPSPCVTKLFYAWEFFLKKKKNRSCHCVKCGVTLLLLAENNHMGKTPQPPRCSPCQKKREKIIPFQLVVANWQCCDLEEWLNYGGKNYVRNGIVQWFPDISRSQRQ